MRARRRGVALSLALAAGIVASGCATWSKPAPRGRDYRLAYPSPPARDQLRAGVIHITSFAVAAAYDSQAMIYRQGEFRIGRYPVQRWAANPGNLVSDMLARDLDASGLFRAVQHARPTLPSDLRLTGEIDVVEESVSRSGCAARLEVRVILVDLGARPEERVLLQSRYEETEPSACEDAGSLARAMSRVVERLSTRLLEDIAARLPAAGMQ